MYDYRSDLLLFRGCVPGCKFAELLEVVTGPIEDFHKEKVKSMEDRLLIRLSVLFTVEKCAKTTELFHVQI
jgi:hypothetical protein